VTAAGAPAGSSCETPAAVAIEVMTAARWKGETDGALLPRADSLDDVDDGVSAGVVRDGAAAAPPVRLTIANITGCRIRTARGTPPAIAG